MRFVMFYHSLVSDWNHGNAHFLRGVASNLLERGHDVVVYAPHDGWSRSNLLAQFGKEPERRFRQAYPELTELTYEYDTLDLDEALSDADVVLVHEWNEPELVSRIGDWRARGGDFALLYHDTHHRIVTDPDGISRFCLDHYDGVLAFGESVAERYRDYGWGKRVWTWHEAADVRRFRPMPAEEKQGDLVWIGNWGDEERTEELREFLLGPSQRLRLRGLAHGVRYPEAAVEELAQCGMRFGGWIPNYEAPLVFARYRMTLHVPRRPYAKALPGVPTIRVFEALACGIPLLSAPWSDSEGLFRPGRDFLVARSGAEMEQHMRTVLNDPDIAADLARSGLETVRSRHTCGHRVDQLLEICSSLRLSMASFEAAGIREESLL